ncbi:MAG: transcription-repair coupling factor, partial [Ignavibacteria bacterium]|nr:transcription-repair coupling factor [Ignavibacteria bacterium]
MNKTIENILSAVPAFEVIKKELYQKNKQITVSAFAGSARQFFTSDIHRIEKQILLLCSSVQIINETKVELAILGLDEYAITLDDYHPETIQEKLTDLGKRKRFILITGYEILKLRLPSKNDIEKNTTKIEVGGNLTFDDLIDYLNSINYTRDKYVENPGDFAVRGSIIDFWSYSEKQPVRLEYDGDFLESIRHFDPESQRSQDKIETVTLAAAIAEDEQSYGDIFDYLDNPLIFAEQYEIKNLFGKKEEQQEFDTLEEIDEELVEELYEGGIKVIQKVDTEVITGPIDNLEKLYSKNARWL